MTWLEFRDGVTGLLACDSRLNRRLAPKTNDDETAAVLRLLKGGRR